MIGQAAMLLLAGAAPAEPPTQPTQFAQLIIRQSVIVRMSRPRAAPPRPIPPMREKKGPKCIQMDAIGGAAVLAPGSIEMVLRGGARYRAYFASSCPDLDYYGGFYVLPTKDGKLCADRDAVHVRSGGQCEIEKFRRLVPAKP